MSIRRIPAALAVMAAVTANNAAASEGGAEGLNLVPLGELVVPIVEGARATGRLKVKLVLRAGDAAGAVRLQASLPALREASLAATAEFARLYASPFAAVDARRLSHDLGAALHARDPGIAAVLIVQVVTVRA